jgi:hypothetical protein
MIGLVISLILLHSPDGSPVEVNPEQITSLVKEKESGNRLYPDNAKCLVRMADGTRIPVTETCDEIQKILER